jgi:hypothetical protein
VSEEALAQIGAVASEERGERQEKEDQLGGVVRGTTFIITGNKIFCFEGFRAVQVVLVIRAGCRQLRMYFLQIIRNMSLLGII